MTQLSDELGGVFSPSAKPEGGNIGVALPSAEPEGAPSAEPEGERMRIERFITASQSIGADMTDEGGRRSDGAGQSSAEPKQLTDAKLNKNEEIKRKHIFLSKNIHFK